MTGLSPLSFTWTVWPSLLTSASVVLIVTEPALPATSIVVVPSALAITQSGCG